MADCEVAVEALKASRSELARQVKTHEKRRNELGHALEAGVEDRDLVCTWHPDYKQNAFLLKRPDTGETIDTRPMSASDLNVELWPAPAAAAPTADAAALPPPPPRSPRPRKAKVTALHPRATAATPTPAA
jgi:hypothetical protein